VALFFPTACRQSETERAEVQYSRIEELVLHGQLDAALTKANQAMREQSRPHWAARFRVEAAKIRQVQGQSDEVIRLLNQDWVPDSTDPDLTAQRLSLLSLAYARQGDSVRATKAIDEADQLKTVSQSVRAEVLAARARLDLEEDNLIEAKSLFQRSLVAARAGGNRFSETIALLNLSVINLQQDHYEDALEQSDAAARVANSIGAQVLLEKARGNAGWAYYETGDYQRALASFNDAAASADTLGSTIDQEIWNNTAGMSEAHLGNFDGARRHYERALALARSLNNASELSHVDQALATLLLHTPHPETAEKYIDDARTRARQTGDPFDIQLGNLLAAQLLAQRGDLPKSEALLSDVEQQSQQFPTIRLDAQHTLAQVYDKEGDHKQAETWFQRSIATYHAQRAQLQTDDARLPFFENGRDLYMDYVAYLVRNHRIEEALAVIDQGRAETLAEGLGVGNKNRSARLRRTSLTTLARQSHAVILVYALSPQGSYLWAANEQKSVFYPLPDRTAILTQVANHRRAILAAKDILAEQHPAARTLYDMLVKPAAHLIHHGDRVFIIGDDGINGLNFETLLTSGESSHYWIEDVTITQLPSLRLMASAHRQTAPQLIKHTNQLLVIGNPIYSGQQYTSLPNAAAEISDVAAHFPENARIVLTGMDASPAGYVRSNPGRFDYVHFVSHAVASELVPLDSAVILSAQGTPDTAKLYARDILSRPLQAKLVTISACQGAGVRAYAGEGLVGLAWAFLRAGSRHVIGALWDVSDASTPELMRHLYDGIGDGNPPDVSLHAAKLEMLRSRGVFRKPLYWGAFQLYSSGQ
jgi:CHAT domain-containing protein/tetratricopeptide (TPR) repeat protein